jgi:hypothetical protein
MTHSRYIETGYHHGRLSPFSLGSAGDLTANDRLVGGSSPLGPTKQNIELAQKAGCI